MSKPTYGWVWTHDGFKGVLYKQGENERLLTVTEYCEHQRAMARVDVLWHDRFGKAGSLQELEARRVWQFWDECVRAGESCREIVHAYAIGGAKCANPRLGRISAQYPGVQ